MPPFPFRLHHIISFLKNRNTEQILEKDLQEYFKKNPALGSKDRRFLKESVYSFIKRKAFFLNNNRSIEEGVLFWKEWFEQGRDDLIFQGKDLLSDAFYSSLEKFYGKKKALMFARFSLEEAPLYIRINPLKVKLEKALTVLKEKLFLEETRSPFVFKVPQKKSMTEMAEFKEGWFEIQDLSSYCALEYGEIKPEIAVLDYCCGGGGKSLAVAALMENRGEIFYNDVRKYAEKKACARFFRAGIEIARPLYKGVLADLLILDMPCTGSGTIRRDPEIKWRINEKYIEKYVLLQREIIRDALPFLKKGGHVLYLTCSVLHEENEDQSDYFTKNFPLKPLKAPFSSFLDQQGGDGFYAHLFQFYPDYLKN